MNVTVTPRLVVKLVTIQTNPETESQFAQLPNVELPVGAAVNVTVLPLGNVALQVLAQLRPEGELTMVPEPLPAKFAVRTGPPEPELVKQTTFAVMKPVTMAPVEPIFPAL